MRTSKTKRFVLAAAAALLLAAVCSGRSSKGSDRWMRAGLDALYKRHQPAEAAEDFRKVLAASPEHYGATFQLALALELSGRRDEANPLWQKVIEMASAVHDPGTAQFAMAHIGGPAATSEGAMMREGLEALYTRQQPAAAAEIFRRVLATNPGHYGANFQIAYALELSGKRDESRFYWEKVVTMAERFLDAGTAKTAREHLAK